MVAWHLKAVVVHHSPIAAQLLLLIVVIGLVVENEVIHVNIVPNTSPNAVHFFLRHGHAIHLLYLTKEPSVLQKLGIKKPPFAKQTMEERNRPISDMTLVTPIAHSLLHSFATTSTSA
jgi:hypothetical protein